MDRNPLLTEIRVNANSSLIREINQAKKIDFFFLKDETLRSYKNYSTTFQCDAAYIKIDSAKLYRVVGSEEDFGPPDYEFYYLNIDEDLVVSSLNPDRSLRKHRPFIERTLEEGDLTYFDSITTGDTPVMEILYDIEGSCGLEDNQENISATIERGIVFNGKDQRVLITLFQLPYNLLISSNEEVIEKAKRSGAWTEEI